jgi:hypothetical protein
MFDNSAKVKRPLWVAGLNVVLALTVGSAQAFADPTPVSSVAELLGVTGENNYVLTRNLDLLSEDANTSVDEIQLADEVTAGNSSYIPYGFAGTFNGGNFTISGLTKPLFYIIGDLSVTGIAEISNLSLTAEAGGVVGKGILALEALIGTEVINVHVVGDVAGAGNDFVGGLVGFNSGDISNSSATGAVTGRNGVGGLVGYNDGGDISNSSATGAVTGDDSVGGLVGENLNGDISNSYASSAVTGDDYTGGLVGENDGDISNSYSTGAVVGDYYTGGLVGWNNAGNISNSYATGAINGDNSDDGQNYFVGGLVGFKNAGNISNSYATGAVVGDDFVGGLVGSNIAGDVSNSYAMGAVTGDDSVGGLVGEIVIGTIDEDSYSSGAVNGVSSDVSPLAPIELLNTLNTGSAPESPIFALASNLNSGRPYLISNPPSIDFSPNFSDISCVPSKELDALRKPVGFKTSKSDLGKLDIALFDQVISNSEVQITGAKLFANSGMCSTVTSVGRLMQLEVNFESSKSLQMWIKSSNNQYVLMGDITFDKDGNAVLPGIDFKKSGQYEFIFVNSFKKDSTQPDLINKVSGVTVYVYK